MGIGKTTILSALMYHNSDPTKTARMELGGQACPASRSHSCCLLTSHSPYICAASRAALNILICIETSTLAHCNDIEGESLLGCGLYRSTRFFLP